MSDAPRVRDWIASGALLPPVGEAPAAVDLARALARLSGAPDVEPGPGTAALAEAIGPADQLIFVLIDGLGCNLLGDLPANSFLRRRTVLELRAVFPSTTATALTSLATAAWPARHAIPGWFTYLPEQDIMATILPFVERFGEKPLEEYGVTAVSAFPCPSVLAAYGRAVRTYHPRAITDSQYTRYQRGASPGDGYDALSDGVDAVCRRVREAQAPTFHYLYIPDVDGAAHRHGWDAPEAHAALANVDAQLARLAEATRPAGTNGSGVRMVMSADHGMLTVPEEAKHVMRADDPIMAALRFPPSGEPRAPLFHVRPGQAEPFRAQFRERWGEWFALLTVREAEELALFGPEPLSAPARARIGDFVGIAAGPDVLLYEANGPAGISTLRGYHGGLTPAEMRIPLIIA